MPLRIAIDARWIRDFGIGTYTRNLLAPMGGIDTEDRFYIVVNEGEEVHLPELPPTFQPVLYKRPHYGIMSTIEFPSALRDLRPDLVHLPLNAVPFLTP